jgi:glutaredoxin
MRIVFKVVRIVLTPVMLMSEKLTTPKGIKRSGAAQADVNVACQQLALFQFTACPFCIKVRKEMARLNLPISKMDAQNDTQNRAELASGGGKIKVPCLRINHSNGE